MTQSRALVTGARGTRSTIALKLTMAISGLLFILFVLVHMYGNLKAFAGQESFDTYAEHLRTLGEPILPHSGFLWILRALLIVALVVHVASAVTLWRRSSQARPQGYAVKRNVRSSLSSRTMRWGGLTLLLFLIWHLLNFSFVKVDPSNGTTGGYRVGQGSVTENDPYTLLVHSFGPSAWWVTVIYLVAMLALGFHLHHGTWSSLQTLGWTNTAAARRRAKAAGWVLAVVIAGGFSLVPLFTLFGVID